MALTVSGARLTVLRVVGIGAAAAGLITAISVLDWLRPPGRRSHLGNFVQRVVDGDATDVVVRKAVASVQTLVSTMGVLSLLIGIVIWVVVVKVLVPRVAGFPLLRTTTVAALAAAVLGTVLNDGGISVWMTLTACFAASVCCLYLDRCVATGTLRPTPVVGAARVGGRPRPT